MSKTTKTSSGDAASAGAKPKRANKKRTVFIHLKRVEKEEPGPVNTHWRTYFLDELVATSNVSAACLAAGVARIRAYHTRSVDPDFHRQWMAALAAGYLNLEMELLCYLRNPDRPAKMDVAGSIRLLTLHRQTVAHERALADDRDEQAVLDSIDAMIDEMRQRSIENTRLLAGPETTDVPGE